MNKDSSVAGRVHVLRRVSPRGPVLSVNTVLRKAKRPFWLLFPYHRLTTFGKSAHFGSCP